MLTMDIGIKLFVLSLCPLLISIEKYHKTLFRIGHFYWITWHQIWKNNLYSSMIVSVEQDCNLPVNAGRYLPYPVISIYFIRRVI